MATVATASQELEHKVSINWAEFRTACDAIAKYANGKGCDTVYGIPTSGCYVALEVSNRMNCPIVNEPREGTVIVDDIIDSGATIRRVLEEHGKDSVVGVIAIRKTCSLPNANSYAHVYPSTEDGYVHFPWEGTLSGPEDAVRRLIQHIGVDANDEGVHDTPRRVVKALSEMTSGYKQSPYNIVGNAMFYAEADEMIVVTDIPFHSLCEHHMLPFSGTATVGYIPNPSPYDRKVIGLSKIPRIVHCYAKRLQIQERLTQQIADGLVNVFGPDAEPAGVGVIIKAHHSCMSLRGVHSPGNMRTSCLLGVFKTDDKARNEFLKLAEV